MIGLTTLPAKAWAPQIALGLVIVALGLALGWLVSPTYRPVCLKCPVCIKRPSAGIVR